MRFGTSCSFLSWVVLRVWDPPVTDRLSHRHRGCRPTQVTRGDNMPCSFESSVCGVMFIMHVPKGSHLLGMVLCAVCVARRPVQLPRVGARVSTVAYLHAVHLPSPSDSVKKVATVSEHPIPPYPWPLPLPGQQEERAAPSPVPNPAAAANTRPCCSLSYHPPTRCTHSTAHTTRHVTQRCMLAATRAAGKAWWWRVHQARGHHHSMVQ